MDVLKRRVKKERSWFSKPLVRREISDGLLSPVTARGVPIREDSGYGAPCECPGDSIALGSLGRLKGEKMDWIEIFRVGKHVDGAGEEKEWQKEDLDRIVSSYNPAWHEAPVVIGHPETDSPAYGWVEALKREGEFLLAKLKDLAPEFLDWVRRGFYKKRSIALYPDLTLRHIGFLGAVPPAIKGLADVKFRESGRITICFSDSELKGVIEMENLKDFDEAVHKAMREKNLSKAKAIAFCAREYPELHQEYITNLSVKGEEELKQYFEESLLNPPHFDKDGRKERERRIYGAAYEYVKDSDPALAQRFAEKLQLSPWEEKSLNAGKEIVRLVNEKMKSDKSLSYSEALSEVQRANRDLILVYIGKK